MSFISNSFSTQTSITTNDYIGVSFDNPFTVGSITTQSDGTLSITPGQPRETSTKRIGVDLYFKYVKSKLNKLEKKNLKEQIIKLQNMVRAAQESDQKALYEVLSEKLVQIYQYANVAATKYNIYVDLPTINKFLNIAYDDKKLSSVKLYSLKEFPRLLPKEAQNIIKSVSKKNLFDDFYVLALACDVEKLQTTKEKIISKDPILFGSIASDKTKMFYLTDWIDEYCDLTLDKFVSLVKSEELPDVTKTFTGIDDKFLKEIQEEVKVRRIRLEGANSRTYKDLASLEHDDEKSRPLGPLRKLIKKIFKL